MSSSGATTLNPDPNLRPRIAVIGGTGLCTFPQLKEIQRVSIRTPFGHASDDIVVGEYSGVRVAFLPRHGEHHTIPPHKIPYRANMGALRQLGIDYVFAACVVGSLKREIPPGSLVLLDQFVDLTWGRDDASRSGVPFVHLPVAQPYCEELRNALRRAAAEIGITAIPIGTVAVIQGPRFSTLAENRWFAANGWDVVNMTQYPECYFARELGMCYAAVAAVTDYCAGVGNQLVFGESGSLQAVLGIFDRNIQTLKKLFLALIAHGTESYSCRCAKTAVEAYFLGRTEDPSPHNL